MINIDDTYKLCNYIARKNRKGFTSGDEFTMLANKASRERYSELLGLPEYQLGRPVPAEAYAMTSAIAMRLKEFISIPTALYVDRSGFATVPSDFILPDVITKKILSEGQWKTVPVELILTHSELSERMISSIRFPSYDYSVCVPENGGLAFTPTAQYFVTMTYLKAPKNVKWAFTIVNNREVYDPANSIDFEWSSIVFNDLVTRILKSIGISLRDGELVALSEQMRKEGI